MDNSHRLQSLFSQKLDRSVFATYFLGAVVPLVALALVAREYVLPSLADEEYGTAAVVGGIVGVGVLTLASFLAPKLTRVVAANVTEAMREDYIRTARANGAGRFTLLWRHALPNALLGATALVGTQFAFLISGAVITKVIFAWPGLGWLLVKSTQTLDFPVIQAAVFVIASSPVIATL